MIITTWLLLALLAACVQVALAVRKANHVIGMLLPAGFLFFGVYAFSHLLAVGIGVNVLLAFMIPPVFLMSLFELVYWRRRFRERRANETE